MWVPGRNQTGYLKKKLFEFLWFDCYLLYYPEGSSIPEHIDEVPGKTHWRLNIIYKNCQEGGVFNSTHSLININRIKLFRSDMPHSVSKIEKGERKVLSFGFVLPKN